MKKVLLLLLLCGGFLTAKEAKKEVESKKDIKEKCKVAADIMSSPILSVDCDDGLKKAAKIAVAKDISSIIVLKDGEPWRILTTFEMAKKMYSSSDEKLKVKELESCMYKIKWVKEDACLDDLAREMPSHSQIFVIEDSSHKDKKVGKGVVTPHDLIAIKVKK